MTVTINPERVVFMGKYFDSSHPEEYIVPVYNSPNLEEVLVKAGIMTKKFQDVKKTSIGDYEKRHTNPEMRKNQ